ncbi:MAG: HEAT repeat domain-containing protein [Limisphaerales bacterium]
MKYKSIKYLLFLCIFVCIEINLATQAQNSASSVTVEDIIASVQANNPDAVDGVAWKLHNEHKQLVEKLLNIFKNAKSSNVERCAAVYYFGDLKISEAVDALAANITLSFNEPVDHLSIVMGASSVNALIEIGSPSIPPLIRNLAESDDVQVRKLSLEVLYQIDGDKDITQLRLQKALKAEKNSQKQARLKSALKALGEIH